MVVPLPQGLDKIPDVQGYLEINSDGAVLSSSGELEIDENIVVKPSPRCYRQQPRFQSPRQVDKTFNGLSVYFGDLTLMARGPVKIELLKGAGLLRGVTMHSFFLSGSLFLVKMAVMHQSIPAVTIPPPPPGAIMGHFPTLSIPGGRH